MSHRGEKPPVTGRHVLSCLVLLALLFSQSTRGEPAPDGGQAGAEHGSCGAHSNSGETLNSDDAHGFVMLDGPLGSVDHTFADTYTIVGEQRHAPPVRRSALTSNQTVLDAVFEHSEETLHVYCNYPPGSDACASIWVDGAEDTIIALPPHVGEGPFARVAALRPADGGLELPGHHLEHRSLQGLSGPVYEMKIDYSFHAITPKGSGEPVHIRIDYSNLHGYWDEMGGAEPLNKRDADKGPRRRPDWHARVNRAVARDDALRNRSTPFDVSVPMSAGHSRGRHGLDKRWWGPFGSWLSKLTTVKKSTLGVLPLAWADAITLFSEQRGCAASGSSASLKIDLEASVNMDMTYAYYFSGTMIPPSIPDAYAYLSMQPKAYVGVHLHGQAEMRYTSEKTRLIPTMTYPGLAIKGIASVGPSLDIYGQIAGKITISGEARAGAHVDFGRTEVYWPQQDEDSARYQKLLGMESSPSVPEGTTLKPVFEADVELDAALDITVQPEASFGIKIGGGRLGGGTAVAEAQLSGYLTGGLSFQASSRVSPSSAEMQYSYGVYLFYNLGYKATALIRGFVDWAAEPREAFDAAKRVDIYGPVTGSIPRVLGRTRAGVADGVPGRNGSADGAETGLERRAPKHKAGSASKKAQKAPFNSYIACPGGGRRKIKLPELRYNCNLLGPTRVAGSGNHTGAVVPGMCQAWRGLAGPPSVLTFSTDETRKRQRRGRQCRADACRREDRKLRVQTGRRVTTACSDAPPSSAEEGGASSSSQLCVPAFQASSWTAAGCEKLMLNLASNWGELEPEPPASGRVDNWIGWGEGLKWTRAGRRGGNVQRPTTYPGKMPLPDGMSRRPSMQTSWVFRRNYTWSAVDNATAAGQWWHASGHDEPTGWGSVLCAINTFQQDRLYRWRGRYNGYCLRGPKSDMYGFQEVQRVARCLVRFAAAESPDRDWEVQDVEYADGPEEDELVGTEPASSEHELDEANAEALPPQSPEGGEAEAAAAAERGKGDGGAELEQGGEGVESSGQPTEPEAGEPPRDSALSARDAGGHLARHSRRVHGGLATASRHGHLREPRGRRRLAPRDAGTGQHAA